MLSSALAAVALLLVNPVTSSNIFARQDACNHDNCYRQVASQTGANQPGFADCTSYLVTSVIPCASTTTTVVTISSTSTETDEADFTSTAVTTDVATSTTVASTTSVTTSTTTLYTSTVLTTSLSVVTTTVTPTQAVNKRAATTPKAILARQDDGTCAGPTTTVGSSVPFYAAACSAGIKYSSVCECLGVVPSTTTLNTPTVTVTQYSLALATETATTSSTFVITTTASNMVVVTSTSVILSTSTVTADGVLTTAVSTTFSTATATASFDGIFTSLNSTTSSTATTTSFDGTFTSLPPFGNGTNSTTTSGFPSSTTDAGTIATPSPTGYAVSGEFKIAFPDNGRILEYSTLTQVQDIKFPRYNPFYLDSNGFVHNLGRDVIYLAIGNTASGNDGVYLKQDPADEQKLVCGLFDNSSINGPINCFVEADQNQNTFSICGPNEDLYISTVADLNPACTVVQLTAVAEFN